jgi:hypothetical protein
MTSFQHADLTVYHPHVMAPSEYGVVPYDEIVCTNQLFFADTTAKLPIRVYHCTNQKDTDRIQRAYEAFGNQSSILASRLCSTHGILLQGDMEQSEMEFQAYCRAIP